MSEYQYPTDAMLETIKNWSYGTFGALMEFVKKNWYAPDWGWHEDGKIYRISTAGWSGNEALISALENNVFFWAVCWVQSRRGGHYEFEIPEWAKTSEGRDPEPTSPQRDVTKEK